MSFFMLLVTAVGLSMDAFAVAMCKGLCMRKFCIVRGIIVGAYFGIFQGLMPLIGYFLGINFAKYIEGFDHWIAFALLGFLGVKMLYEALGDEEESAGDKVDFKTMFPLAIATSIDALAVGISLAMAGNVNIWVAILLIGITTGVLSGVGVKIGNVFGSRFEKKAQIAGGAILILLGLKILLEGLGVI